MLADQHNLSTTRHCVCWGNLTYLKTSFDLKTRTKHEFRSCPSLHSLNVPIGSGSPSFSLGGLRPDCYHRGGWYCYSSSRPHRYDCCHLFHNEKAEKLKKTKPYPAHKFRAIQRCHPKPNPHLYILK